VAFESNISKKIMLRDLQLREDYKHIAVLLNSIEPGSTTVEALKDEDRHIPQESTLTLND
jgi:hypothetical protein